MPTVTRSLKTVLEATDTCKITVKKADTATIESLRKGSALTFEGTTLDAENIEWLYGWFKENNLLLSEDAELVAYTWTGRQFNSLYGLEGNKRYKAGLNFLALPLDGLRVPALAVRRFDLGGRWLDDIVDNLVPPEEDEEDEI